MKVTAIENGPNKVEFEGTAFRVSRDGEGAETVERAVFFLCRCGHSNNKPFCDGTHKQMGFEAPGAEIDAT
jgi:CDGSH-type Zn-finger protein